MPRRTPRLLTAATAAFALVVTGLVTALPAAEAAAISTAAPAAATAVSDVGDPARSISTEAGKPIPRPSGLSASASPATIAKAVVGARAAELGLRGTLSTLAVRPTTAGGSVVRLQQLVSGVPVLGGEVVVDVDSAGRTNSISSELLPGVLPGTTATIAVAKAETTALAAADKARGGAGAALQASTPTLAIYDPRIFGAPGIQTGTLVWRSEVTSNADAGIRRLLLVDALSGKVVLNLDQIAEGRNRTVCDANNTVSGIPCTAPVRVEGGPPVGAANSDVNLAYDYAGKTYDFYLNTLGRDSINGSGLPLVSTVRYCPSLAATDCPYENAFWNGQQMVYGDGFASADDVVAHELTHGVTEYNNNLYYYYQSGAINESLSDIFGDFIDQTDGVGNDTAGVAWKMGEDLPASIGIIRDMKNPPLYGDPDRTGSSLYYGGAVDAGGVHSNSGVGNKFAYLLAAGDTFNGHTVTGIGITKAARIIYRASQNLTSGADYKAFATGLRSACTALTAVPSSTVVAADCTSVSEAIAAVEMDVPPTNASTAPAPVCPVGTVPTSKFSDNMENPGSGKWLKSGTAWNWSGHPSNTQLWFYGSDPGNPYGSAQRYAVGGRDNLWGDDLFLASDHQVLMAAGVALPANAFLRFDHAFGFEADSGGQYDGGVVEYTINNGATWLDAGPLMSGAGENGYGFNVGGAASSVISLGNGTNAIRGRTGFVRQSQGYVSTRANLASLAGKTVKFRFRSASDSSGGDYGWFLDNVKIYTCGALLTVAGPPAVALGASTLTWAGTDVTGQTTTTYRTRSAAPGASLPAFGAWKPAPTSRSLSVPLPAAGGSTCVEIRSVLASPALSSSVVRCTSRPVDDRKLKAKKTWSKVKSSKSFAGTLSSTTKKGASLTLASARGTRLVIVAETLKTGGTIGVYVGSRKVATISLKSSKTVLRKTFDLAVAGLAGGSVTIKVLSKDKTVAIDGIAVRP